MRWPLVFWMTRNCAVRCGPDVRSVARIWAGWVGASTLALTTTCAEPEASETTVIDAAFGSPGLVLTRLYGPDTTAKRACRPAPGAPPGPSAVMAATPVWPEQIAVAPGWVRFGVTLNVLSSV